MRYPTSFDLRIKKTMPSSLFKKSSPILLPVIIENPALSGIRPSSLQIIIVLSGDRLNLSYSVNNKEFVHESGKSNKYCILSEYKESIPDALINNSLPSSNLSENICCVWEIAFSATYLFVLLHLPQENIVHTINEYKINVPTFITIDLLV